MQPPESSAAQDHATTIRRAIPGPLPWTKAENDRKRALDNAALVAVDALVAENEQLRRERDDFEQRLHAYKSGEIA